MNVEEALKTSGRNNLQQPGVVRWRAARQLFIFRVQQLCLVMDHIVGVHLHVSSHVWIRMKNLVLFLGVTGDMQTLAGSGEIQGKGAIYPTDFVVRAGTLFSHVPTCPSHWSFALCLFRYQFSGIAGMLETSNCPRSTYHRTTCISAREACHAL